MPATSARAAFALLLSTAIGCQEMSALSKYDPLIRLDKPSDVQVASAGSASLAPAAAADAQVHYVGYAPDDTNNSATLSSAQSVVSDGARGDSSRADSANAINAATADAATTSLLSPGGANASKPSWLADKTGPSGAAWNDLFVTRGQGPIRSVFTSDRTLMAAIVIAAIVIPFAVHDSRQANPPHQ